MERKLSFKQRNGFDPIEQPLIDVDERLYFHINKVIYRLLDAAKDQYNNVIENIYLHYFNEDLKEYYSSYRVVENFKYSVNEKFKYFFEDQYMEYLDYWEFFFLNYFKKVKYLKEFDEIINNYFERFNSNWRYIEFGFVKIVNEEEIETIKQTLNHEFDPIRKHSRDALALMRGEDASFTNSIQNSLSMVEAALQKITGEQSQNVDPMIEKLKKKETRLVFTKELDAISKLHGVASSKKAGGIRHAMQEEVNYTYEDALYLYVRCSAFVNWVLATYPKVA